jgi:hypothetical protein
VDEKVVTRAKRYAAKHGFSVSHLVEVYLDVVTRSPRPVVEEPPVLKLLRGAAKGMEPEAHRNYLSRKFR